MNFDTYVKNELNLLTESDAIKSCLFKLMEKFSEQGHSGMSAAVVSMSFVSLVKDDKPIPDYLFSKKDDFYGGMTGRALKELIEVYQNNCKDCDKAKVLDYFYKLASYKPLTPLTFANEEWQLVQESKVTFQPVKSLKDKIVGFFRRLIFHKSFLSDSLSNSLNESMINKEDSLLFQNVRDFAVFIEGRNGKPHTIDAYYIRDQEGDTFTGSLTTSKGAIRHCYIKDPANMPKVCIDVIHTEVDPDTGEEKAGTGWWNTTIKDESQLEELEKYYDVEYV